MRIHCSSNISKTLLMFLAVLLFANECDSSKEETKLVKELLRGYESTIRPVARFQDLITVNFSLALQQIVDLDEKNQLLTTSMYMTWSWMDSHLQWEPEEHDNITFLRLPAKKVWKPDILVYNSAVDSFDQMLHTNVIVEHSGKVEWLPPGLFKTTCDVDIAYFPFDEQKCKIKFGAWTHHGDLVDLNIPDEGNADTSAYIESGEWDLKSMVGQRNYVKYDCCPNPFVDITFTIHMQRRTLFYGFNLILPCVLVCSLTILIFLLPADSGERITLGITVLLAMVVFLQLVAENLPPTGTIPLLGITVLLSLTVFLLLVADIIPPTSLTTPLISKYFACSIVMVTLSVIATVVSLNFHHTSAATIDEMPMWIEVVFLKFLPTILLMKMPGLQKTQTATENNRTEGEPLIKVGERLGNWRSDQLDGSDPTSRTALQQLRREERQISEMCRDLHDIVQRKRDEDEDEKIALKWRFAATVLDRFCLVFFIFFFILSTVLTIGMAPGLFS